MYDFILAVYQGLYVNGTFLQFLPCASASMTRNFFGEIGPAKYTINTDVASMVNAVAPNRVDAYRYYSTTSSSASVGATTIVVHTGSRFHVGDNVAIWNGSAHDFSTVSAISGNTLTLSSALTNTYAVEATVYKHVHRGVISSVDKNPARVKSQTIQVVSYFQQLADFYPATASSDGRECGWFLYQLLSAYSSSLDLVINSANFSMSSTGYPAGGGTGVGYQASNTNAQLLQVINDVLNVSNGASQNTNTGNRQNSRYNLWIDLNNVVHFGLVNQATVTKTYNCKSWTAQTDGFYDLVEAHNTHDNDTTNLKNDYVLFGGTQGSGGSSSTSQSVKVEVEDQTSVNTYGQKQKVLTYPSITDPNTLQAIGTSLLNASAYPVNSYQTSLSRTANEPSAQDVIKVTNITDTSTDVDYSVTYVPQTIEYIWNQKQRDFFGVKISGGQLLPDINAQMKQITAQHYIPTNVLPTGSTNILDRFVQTGVVGSYNGSVFSMTAGTIVANVLVSGNPVQTEFSVSASTYTASTDPTVTVAFLYRNADGTQYSTPHIVTWAGLNVPVSAGYTIWQTIPLYVLTVLGGQITYTTRVWQPGGVGSSNIVPGSVGSSKLAVNPNPSQAPVLASGYTYPLAVTALATPSGSYDAKFTYGLTVTNPTWLDEIRTYALPQGTTFSKILGFKGAVPPTSNGVYTSVVDGLNAGTAYDIYITFLDFAGIETPPLKIATTNTNTQYIGRANQAAGAIGVTPSCLVQSAYSGGPVGSGVGNSTVDAHLGFYTDNTGTTDTSWLFEVQLIAAIHGTSNWQIVGSMAPAAPDGSHFGQYTGAIFAGLGSTNVYDLSIRYVDYAGNFSNPASPVLWSSYAVPALALGTQSLPAMPSGTTCSATQVGSISYSAQGNASYQATISFTPACSDSNYSRWYAALHVGTKQLGTGVTTNDGDTATLHYYDQKTVQGTVSGNASTFASPTTVTIPIDAGANYTQVAITFEDQAGNTTAAYPFTVVPPQQVSNAALAGMPSAIKAAGPTVVSANVPTRTVNKSAAHKVSLTITIGSGTTTSDYFLTKPGWLDTPVIVARNNGDTGADANYIETACEYEKWTNNGNGTLTVTVLQFAAIGNAVDFGIYYTDQSGAKSATVYPANWVNVGDPNGDFIDPGDGGALKPGKNPINVRNRISLSSALDVSTTPGAVTGNLPLTNHASTIQNRNGIYGGFEGATPYMNGYTLTFPSIFDMYRPDGSYSYVAAGSTLSCSGNIGYGFVFLVWNNNAAGSLLYVPRTSLSSAYTNNTAYELIGQTTGSGVFVSGYASNAGLLNATGNVITQNNDNTGYLNVDRAHPSKVMPLVNHDAMVARTPYRNLVKNSNFQLGEALATGGGWIASNGGTGIASGIYAGLGMEYLTAPINGGMYQTISVKPNTTYSIAALMQLTTAGQAFKIYVAPIPPTADLSTDTQPAGSLSATGYYLNGSALNGSRTTSTLNVMKLCAGQFASGSNTAVRLYVQSMNGTASCYVGGVMLWEGTKWQEYDDGDVLPGSINNSHIQNVNLDYVGDGSTYGSLPLVNVSGSGTGKRALIDYANGSHVNVLPLAKSDQVIQNRTAIHGGFEGAAPYMNGYTLTFPSTFDCFRPDGSYSYVTGGSTLACSGNTGYGFVFIQWNNNAAGTLVYVPRPSLSSTYTGSTVYELIGQTTGSGVFSSPYAANVNTVNAAQSAITQTGTGGGILNIDTNAGTRILQRGNTHGDFTSTIDVGGGLVNSAQISKYIYNSVAYETDAVIVSSTGASPYPLQFYIGGAGVSGQAPNIWLPSASSSPVSIASYGTSGSKIAAPSPLTSTTASDTIYISATYKPGSTAGVMNTYAANVLQTSTATGNGWTLYFQKNANFSLALSAALYADGYAVITSALGGGSGTAVPGGSGGGGNSRSNYK